MSIMIAEASNYDEDEAVLNALAARRYDEDVLNVLAARRENLPDVTRLPDECRTRWIQQLKLAMEDKRRSSVRQQASFLLVELLDPDTVESVLREYRVLPGPRTVGLWLRYSRQPELILKLAQDLESNEPVSNHLFDGDRSIERVSVQSSIIIRNIILNADGFTRELKDWAKTLEPHGPAARELLRKEVREWVKANRRLLQEKRWNEIEPPRTAKE